MTKKVFFKIKGVTSLEVKAQIETSVDVLNGVKDIAVNPGGGESWVEFDEQLISFNQIRQTINDLGYVVQEDAKHPAKAGESIREYVYFVKGMHCASCEVLIEKKIMGLPGIKAVEASLKRGTVVVEYIDKCPTTGQLNNIFATDHYQFFNQAFTPVTSSPAGGFWQVFGVALLIVIGFIALNKFGLASLVNVTANSSLPLFFAFGLLAGVSTCAALVGGIILAMSKQWLDLYAPTAPWQQKIKPHILFNLGRLVIFSLLGAILGAIGSKLQLSLTFASFLVIGVSILMIGLGLQMLGVKAFARFQFGTPKFLTRYVADEKNFRGKYMPFILGGLTFFLPCGFTITAQSLALLSGSAWQGALIMMFFVLGTVPVLLAIGLASVTFSRRPHWSATFAKVAGAVVLFFALFNINAQLNVLGVGSVDNFILRPSTTLNATTEFADDGTLAPVLNGKQIIKMEASSYGYNPNYFRVRVGVPVRWEITDTGTSGCTNAIISRSLFDGQIALTNGQVSVKEFTPAKAGKYKFSCWMGMITGIIEVVDKNTSAQIPAAQAAGLTDNNIIPSGAKGCGCGGGGASCGAAPQP